MILVTGASGYIGEAVLRAAAAAGIETAALARRDTFAPTQSFIPYDLSRPLPADLPDSATVIHLAYHPDVDNLAAAQRWIDYAQGTGGKLIFVSSQTARANAPTVYGYDKWRIERRVLNAGQIVVRPGMVYGGREAGLYGLIKKLLNLMILLPDFRPAPQIQPVHVDDLAASLIAIAWGGTNDTYNIGYETPIGFTAFLQQLARDAGQRRFFLPFPARWLNGLMASGERMPKAIRQKLQSLQSLFDLPAMATNNIVPLRPFFSKDTEATRAAKKIFRQATGTAKPEWIEPYLKISPGGNRKQKQLTAIAIAQGDPTASRLFHDATRGGRWRSFLTLPFLLLEEAWQRLTGLVMRRG